MGEYGSLAGVYRPARAADADRLVAPGRIVATKHALN